jgi:hypothetical protein
MDWFFRKSVMVLVFYKKMLSAWLQYVTSSLWLKVQQNLHLYGSGQMLWIFKFIYSLSQFMIHTYYYLH